MPQIEFRQAIAEAIAVEMEADDSVVLFGEDVAFAGGVFQATRGLHARFGSDRVIDTPISELALASAAFGAAVTGSRPIIEIMFGDFMFLAMDSLVNQAAKYWFISGEQHGAPLVIRSAVGGGGRFGAIHSQIPVPWLLGVPGIKIVAPSTPSDAYSLLRAAIRDDNPVVFLEHKRLYGMVEEVDGYEAEPGRIGAARVVRPGDDVTLVGAMRTVGECLVAADELANHGVRAEVIDLRTIRPLDHDTVLRSVARTRRLIAVEEGPATGGWSAELLAVAGTRAEGLEAMSRVTCPDLPLPFSGVLEDSVLPSSGDVVARVLSSGLALGAR